MRTNQRKTPRVAFVILSALFAAVAVYGCSSAPAPTDTAASGASGASTRPAFTLFGPTRERSGQQIWADNCSRCHNMRPAGEFSGVNWAMIANHMRSRADLTGDEQRKVTLFLKASN